VPGHEIVGVVQQLGAEVNNLVVGTRVGIGWQSGACLECEWCASGRDNLCPESQATCVGRYGGFADTVIADSRYVFPLPDGITSENAAPLFCAGITVYSPLSLNNIRPHMRVGVVGVGGLGHLALQFANAFGCEVTAFSSSPSKEPESRVFGADRFINSHDPGELEAAAGTQDFVIVTVNVDLDWQAYLNVLKPGGHLCFVGAVPSPMPIHAMALIAGGKSLSGSPIGGRKAIAEMLDFAARHGIEPQVEVMPIYQVNEAFERIRANQARYRIVLRN
jgi:uncharacterized zinc-type alcohol dehydrogenase-like protein